MANVLPIYDSSQHSELAIVQSGFGRDFMVQSNAGVYRASLAFSCLVTPLQGDNVLVNVGAKQRHILAIIERPNENDMALSFPGNVAFEAKSGEIKLISARSISLTSAEKVQLTSAELGINNVNTQLHTSTLSVKGDAVVSQWREITSISDVANYIINQLTQRIKNSFKKVEGVDQQSSQNYIQSVEKTMTVRSRDSVITARKDMKIDGERIHMG